MPHESTVRPQENNMASAAGAPTAATPANQSPGLSPSSDAPHTRSSSFGNANANPNPNPNPAANEPLTQQQQQLIKDQQRNLERQQSLVPHLYAEKPTEVTHHHDTDEEESPDEKSHHDNRDDSSNDD